MENFQNAISTLLQLLTTFGLAVAAILSGFEMWLRGALKHAGVQPPFQTVILLTVAVLLVVGSLRLFGGLIRVAAVLILLLIAIHIVLPVIQG